MMNEDFRIIRAEKEDLKEIKVKTLSPFLCWFSIVGKYYFRSCAKGEKKWRKEGDRCGAK